MLVLTRLHSLTAFRSLALGQDTVEYAAIFFPPYADAIWPG